jgi:hypothetical protein
VGVSPLEYTRERIRAFLDELGRVKESDFPYEQPKEALSKIGADFQQRLDTLLKLSNNNDPSVVQTACSEATSQIFAYLPLLGFILRSTNVRNSFEIYSPLLRLARQILGPSTKLIISSEWEFSPFVYLPMAELPNFVLIGLPANESGNPLLAPLAGHEMGHTVWRQRSLDTQFEPHLENSIYDQIQLRWGDYSAQYPGADKNNIRNDLFTSQIVATVLSWALRQVEETFCDMMGVRLFGEAYLHAFAYLLAPGLPGQRPEAYPNMKTRVGNMLNAAGEFGIDVPSAYGTWFVDQPEPGPANAAKRLLLSLSDGALTSVVSELIRAVRMIADEAKVPQRSALKVAAICDSFRLLVPAAGAESMANILNAAWNAYHDGKLWEDMPLIFKKRDTVVREIVLKSVEVFEIEQRLVST